MNAHHKMINEKLGKNYNSYQVVRKWTQIVAGTNYYYNLLAGGRKYSVNIFKPLLAGADS